MGIYKIFGIMLLYNDIADIKGVNMRKNKRIKFVIIIGFMLGVGGVMSAFLFSKNRLYKKLGFELPTNIEIIEMETQNNVKTLLGIDNERLAIKFVITDDDLDNFFELLENTSEVRYRNREDLFAVPHNENVINDWDLDYEKLEYYYSGNTTRLSFLYEKRGTITICVTEAENGERWVYICYLG